MKDAKDVIKSATRAAKVKFVDCGCGCGNRKGECDCCRVAEKHRLERGAQGASEHARRKGTCDERISNGIDHDACGEPAVIMMADMGRLCASCAESRIERLQRIVSTVREAVK